jgi:glycosyltransferase involved in cell wall biosynthesis
MGLQYPEALMHRLFGSKVSKKLQAEPWDVVHLWSGVAEESLNVLDKVGTLRLVVRGSAHIRAQHRLLKEEELRTGTPQDKPSSWIISREEREYRLADGIVVISSFAYRTFLEEGVPSEKVNLLVAGVREGPFRPPSDVVEARIKRITSGGRLRVLFVGALSFRKGLWDLEKVARTLANEEFDFQFVGPITPEATKLVAKLKPYATFTGKQPQEGLAHKYAWADVFVFPTIEDGYPQVLAQASASALPILTTTNCSGPDLVREGENGWVVPIRRADLLLRRLRWCGKHRRELAAMVKRIYESYRPRSWDDVAKDYEVLCQTARETEGKRAAGIYAGNSIP